MTTTKNLTTGDDNFSPDQTYDIINGLDGNDTIDLRLNSIDFQPTAWNFAFTVNGGNGNDVLIAGPGLHGGTDTATLNGDAGNDTLTGGENFDTLNGGDDNDILQGHTNRITVLTSGPSDSLDGGNGTDTMVLNYQQFYFPLPGSPPQPDLTKPMAVTVDITKDGTVHITGDHTSAVYLGEAFKNMEILNFNGPEGDDIVTGGALNDVIQTNGGNDTIIAGGGDDVIIDEYDHINIDGGSGNDYLSLTPNNISADVVVDPTTGKLTVGGADFGSFTSIEHLDFFGGSGNDTITGLTDTYSSTVSRLFGNAGDDIIVAGNSATILDGGAGNDTLTGGNGNDTINGGAGKDTIHAGGGDDIVGFNISTELVAGELYDGGSGNDTLAIGSNDGNIPLIDFTQFTVQGFETLTTDLNSAVTSFTAKMTTTTFSQFTHIDATANPGHFTVQFSDNGSVTVTGKEQIAAFQLADGGQSIDVSGEASGSTEQIFGGSGDDTITGPNIARFFTASGGAGNDHFIGKAALNTFNGGAGNDILTGGSSNDTLDGGANGDTLDGGGGTNTLSYVDDTSSGVTVNFTTKVASGGDAAGDIITFASFANLTGGAGNDVLTGDGNANVIKGSQGFGPAGNDTLDGLGGNDTLTGGSGNDTLDGGAGNDTMSGGGGNDTYIYDGQGLDTITGGFSAGVNGDVIKITSTYSTFADVQKHIAVGTTDTVISFSAGNSLTIKNFKTALTADNFSFTVDNTPPTITSVASTPGSGSAVHLGQPVTIDLTISENVTVVGTPTLTLNDKGVATYDTVNSTPTDLKFTYTPAAGQNTADLQTTALVLGKGGTIKDDGGNALNLTGAAKQDLHLTVDTIAPTVTAALQADTGASTTDHITSNRGLTGTADPNANVSVLIDGGAGGSQLVVASAAGVWTYVPPTLTEGPHTVQASETDAAGNIGSASLNLTYDSNGPHATAIGNNGGPFALGEAVIITLTMNEAIRVIGSPTMTLDNGGTATYSAADSSLATGVVAFRYVPTAGQDTNDLHFTTVNLPTGAKIQDVAGNDATLLSNQDLHITIDTVAPTITSVTTPLSGAVPAGQTVEIDVHTSEAVNVVGTPTLALSDKGVANYVSGSGTSNLVFHYIVAPGQNTADLLTTSLKNAKGGTITDLAGNPLNLTGAAKQDLHLAVDTIAPLVTGVVASPASGAVAAGADVLITLTLNDKVTVTGAPTLALNDGATAAFDSGSGTNALVFKYHVGSESTTDLQVTGINQSVGNTITDAAGNKASSTLSFDAKDSVNVFTWKTGTTGAFDTASNWTPAGGPPSVGNTAVIAATGNYIITSSGDSIGVLTNTNKTASLEIQSNTFSLGNNNVSTTSTNAGTIQVDNQAGLTLDNMTLANSGTLSLNATTGFSFVEIANAVTLNGAGHITLSDPNLSVIEAFSPITLTNVDNTISGAGIIDDNHGLSLLNQAKGIVNADAATGALQIVGTSTVTNAGILEGTNTGGLILQESVINNSNLIEALGIGAKVVLDGGTITNTGAGSVLVSGTNAHIDLDGETINGGAVTVSKGSALDTINDHDSTITVTKLTNTAGAIMADHGDLTINGPVTNTGVLAASNGNTLDFTGAVTGKGTGTIATGGTLEFEGASSAFVTFLDHTGTLELDNATTKLSKFTGTVTGFSHGNDIELGAINFTTGDPQLSFSGSKLTVTDGTHLETLTFVGTYTLADFHTANVGGHVDLLHV